MLPDTCQMLQKKNGRHKHTANSPCRKKSITVKSTIRWTTERKSDSGALGKQALSSRSQKKIGLQTLVGRWRRSRGTSGRREEEGE